MVVEIVIHRTKKYTKKYNETLACNITYRLHNLTLSAKWCRYIVCSVDTQLSLRMACLPVCLALHAVQNDGYFNFN